MAELLETCNNSNKRLSISTFMNNIILLIYKLFIERNCCMLLQAHNQCLDWARKYRVTFASEKYELIHLAHQLKRFNMQAQLQLGEIAKQSSILVCILEIWLNLKLWWEEHVKIIKHKIITQINMLLHIIAFTWRAIFINTQLIYNAVVRLALIYKSVVWHAPD